MKIVVTGANGFIGKNSMAQLQYEEQHEVFAWTRDGDPALLEKALKNCDVLLHLAGVNRPQNEEAFMQDNVMWTQQLVAILEKYDNPARVIATSSIQAENNTAYGRSKRAMEDVLFDYTARTGADVYMYRLPNVFGKWSRPYYNSVVATFCHQIARDEPIEVHEPEATLTLCYIDDVVAEFLRAIDGFPNRQGHFCAVAPTYDLSVGELAGMLGSFSSNRTDLMVANMADELTKKLYSTYSSFLPREEFAYDLQMHSDHRGSFTEFLRTAERGQVSINVSKPGVTKGNHWHHTKLEKFLVVSGEAVIRFRHLVDGEVVEYYVCGEKLQVVDIPAGYTHAIENVGDHDLVTVMWANECFDISRPDTYVLEVST